MPIDNCVSKTMLFRTLSRFFRNQWPNCQSRPVSPASVSLYLCDIVSNIVPIVVAITQGAILWHALAQRDITSMEVIISGCLLCAALVKQLAHGRFHWRAIDVFAMVAVLAFGVMRVAAPTLSAWEDHQTLLRLYCAVVAYFSIRLFVQGRRSLTFFVAISTIVGTILALLGLRTAWGPLHTLSALTQLNVADFRGRIPAPWGHKVSDWASLLLAFVSYPLMFLLCVRRKSSEVLITCCYASALILTGCLATLLRGATAGVIVFLIAATWAVVRWARISIWRVATGLSVLVTVVVAALAILGLLPAIGATAGLGSRESQVLSTEVRLEQYKVALPLIRTHFWRGIGAGQFPRQVLSLRSKHEHSGVGFELYSLPIELFVERGFLGAALAMGFFWVLLLLTARTMNGTSAGPERLCGIIACVNLLALVVRDLTYSSLVSTTYMCILVGFLAGLITNGNLATLRQRPRTAMMRTTWIAALSTLAIGAITYLAITDSISVNRVEETLKRASDAAIDREITESAKAMCSLPASDLENAYVVATRGLFSAQTAGLSLTAINNGAVPHEGIVDAMNDYRHAIIMSPNDDNFISNLAWIMWARGDRVGAIARMQQALRMDPGSALTHVGMAMLWEKSGNDPAAFAEYKAAVVADPSLLRAPVFMAKKDTSDAWYQPLVAAATKELESKVARQSNDVYLLARLGSLYEATGRPELAEPLLLDASNRLPHLVRPWVYCGRISLRRRELSESLRKFRVATVLDPSECFAWQGLGETFRRLQMPLDGADAYRLAAHLAAEPWSTHARRCQALYHVRNIIKDDILPVGLLTACTARPIDTDPN